MINFTVYGTPKGKGRPRMTKTGHVYTPQQTIDYEEKVRIAWKKSAKGRKMTGALSVEILVFFETPKNWSMKKKTEMMGKFAEKKPDIDNVAKIILDALNKLAYHDDSQVVAISCQKMWGTESKVHVSVETIG
ncbi:MAG: RusA family crossover junction endodeoxyribonuclease [Lachnospiraceae bacterium]